MVEVVPFLRRVFRGWQAHAAAAGRLLYFASVSPRGSRGTEENEHFLDRRAERLEVVGAGDVFATTGIGRVRIRATFSLSDEGCPTNDPIRYSLFLAAQFT
jgi:hypothetical protein